MAHCLDYAKISSAAYHSSKNQYYADQPGHMVDNWQVHKFESGSLFGSGFQGGIWQNDTDVVVGCCGTNPSKPGKFVNDLHADFKIALHFLPNQTYAAQRMVRLAKEIANGRRVSVTGHSLGGGLAQAVAVWESIPFVTFNSPAMKFTMKMSKYNVLQPYKMMRSLAGRSVSESPGLNFRINGDFVSCKILGNHVGTIVNLSNPKALYNNSAHSQSNCWQAVLNTDWAFIDPFEAI